MKPIEQALSECQTIAELEAQVVARDVEVQRLRREMAALQEALEPLRLRAQALAAGPANLRQLFKVGGN